MSSSHFLATNLKKFKFVVPRRQESAHVINRLPTFNLYFYLMYSNFFIFSPKNQILGEPAHVISSPADFQSLFLFDVF